MDWMISSLVVFGPLKTSTSWMEHCFHGAGKLQCLCISPTPSKLLQPTNHIKGRRAEQVKTNVTPVSAVLAWLMKEQHWWQIVWVTLKWSKYDLKHGGKIQIHLHHIIDPFLKPLEGHRELVCLVLASQLQSQDWQTGDSHHWVTQAFWLFVVWFYCVLWEKNKPLTCCSMCFVLSQWEDRWLGTNLIIPTHRVLQLVLIKK